MMFKRPQCLILAVPLVPGRAGSRGRLLPLPGAAGGVWGRLAGAEASLGVRSPSPQQAAGRAVQGWWCDLGGSVWRQLTSLCPGPFLSERL